MSTKNDMLDKWLQDVRDFVLQRAESEEIGNRLWEMLDRECDGSRSLPENGFMAELAFAVAALEAIAKQNFPHANHDLENASYELFASRTLAAVALSAIFH